MNDHFIETMNIVYIFCVIFFLHAAASLYVMWNERFALKTNKKKLKKILLKSVMLWICIMLCPYHKCNNEQSDLFIYRSTIECCSGFRKYNGERTGKYLEEMSLIRFSTISVRLVYIKMINYRGSILANLIKQCNQ